MTKIKDIPENYRPREKYLKFGIESLSNSELLSIIIGNGTKGVNALKLSKQIMEKFNNQLIDISVEDLLQFSGIGNAKAVKIVSSINLVKRLIKNNNGLKDVNNIKKSFTFIDLFAGIGGIKLGFKNIGGKCVFSNDSDSQCKITYDLNFSSTETPMVLGKIENIPSMAMPDFDILTAGFPCQPFSIAGYQKGFLDTGRGNLFFEIIRILRDKKPKSFLLENVKNLKSHDKGRTYQIIYSELKNLGYYVFDKVLNTMEYGNIPQNRERIYIVGFKEEESFKRFEFPQKILLTKSLQDCLENNIEKKYYYNDKPLFNRLKGYITKKDVVYQWRRKYVRENKSGVCPTLTANMGTGGHNVPIVIDKYGIRKLTPRECANLQGFPKSFKLPNIADSNLYKQLGNSVSIPVIERVARRILESLE